MENEFWIARDKPCEILPKGSLCLFSRKPERNEFAGFFGSRCLDGGCPLLFYEDGEYVEVIFLNPDSFPEVTWENSPQRLTITK